MTPIPDYHSTHPLRLIVCGGRDYDNAARVAEVLDGIHAGRGIVSVTSGRPNPTGEAARAWAREHLTGEGGDGPLGIVAFPGAPACMADDAKEAGLVVWEVE